MRALAEWRACSNRRPSLNLRNSRFSLSCCRPCDVSDEVLECPMFRSVQMRALRSAADLGSSRARLSGVRRTGPSAVAETYTLEGMGHWSDSIALYGGVLSFYSNEPCSYTCGLWLLLALCYPHSPFSTQQLLNRRLARALACAIAPCACFWVGALPLSITRCCRLIARISGPTRLGYSPVVMDSPARNSRAPTRMCSPSVLLAFHVTSTMLMVRAFSLWALLTAQRARACLASRALRLGASARSRRACRIRYVCVRRCAADRRMMCLR
jgi:hypothetical protein